jgi:hypothetical protein
LVYRRLLFRRDPVALFLRLPPARLRLVPVERLRLVPVERLRPVPVERLPLPVERVRRRPVERVPLLPPLRERLVLRERLAVERRLPPLPLRLRRVEAALRADAERDDLERDAAARPPLLPPFREELRLVFLPRPEPLFFPPPVSLFTVAQARRPASRRETPRSSYPSSICSAWRFCLLV